LARTKHAKPKPEHTRQCPKNLGQKGLTKVVKICVKICQIFVSKGQIDVRRGIIAVKGDKMVSKQCWTMYIGFSRFRPAISGICFKARRCSRIESAWRLSGERVGRRAVLAWLGRCQVVAGSWRGGVAAWAAWQGRVSWGNAGRAGGWARGWLGCWETVDEVGAGAGASKRRGRRKQSGASWEEG
jgi:hypothetical protein